MKKSLAVLTFAAAMVSGSAFAMVPSSGWITSADIVGLGDAHVRYIVDDGVVNLSGDVETHAELALVKGFAKKIAGVDRVQSAITVN